MQVHGQLGTDPNADGKCDYGTGSIVLAVMGGGVLGFVIGLASRPAVEESARVAGSISRRKAREAKEEILAELRARRGQKITQATIDAAAKAG